MSRALLAIVLLASLGCAAPPTRRTKTIYADPEPKSIAGPRWLLRRAVCTDDGRPIEELTGELDATQVSPTRLLMALSFEVEDCSWTSLYAADGSSPCTGEACPVTLSERFRVIRGRGTCELRPNGESSTTLHWDGRALSFTLASQSLCQNGQTRLDLEVHDQQARDATALVELAVASLRVGDAETLATLLADEATLSHSVLGTGTTAEDARGRDAITRWVREHTQAPTPRLVRLLDITDAGEGRFTATWEHESATPNHGTTHVLLRANHVLALEDVTSAPD